MGSSRDLKIIIFENDQSIASLLKIILHSLGYNNFQIFSDPSDCPPCMTDPTCKCLQEVSRADVMISDIRMITMDGIEFIRLQKMCGCKMPNDNRALMSAAITPREQKIISELGCHFIKKPFKIDEIEEWLRACEKRAQSRDGYPCAP